MNCSKGIKYNNYYVAFLDILGFKKLAESNKLNNKKIICNYFNLINNTINKINTCFSGKHIKSIIISDSIILSVKTGIKNKDKIQNLRQLCIAVQQIQFELTLMNLWLRGGISTGKAYFNSDENQVVGPAYVNAFLLEENVAMHPRVILDNNIIKALDIGSAQELIEMINNDGLENSDYDFVERNILFRWTQYNYRKISLDKDIAFFVDYLVYAFTDEIKLTTVVNNIKNNIYNDNSIYIKFRWVTDYLLACCEFHMERGCKIDSKKLNNIYNSIMKI